MKIPLSNVVYVGNEVKYAQDALQSTWIGGGGKYITDAAEALKPHTGCHHVTLVANGTQALIVALMALGIEPGDEVLVPALTFAAPAAAVKLLGATPVLVDIDCDSWAINPIKARDAITERTRAIIAVDVLGHPADYNALRRLNLPIIQDSAEAHGAQYSSKIVGSHGDIACFSFHANKIITCGEGGAVTTNDDRLAERIRLIVNHGMKEGYRHPVVGTNARMTNVTAAILLAQVERWYEAIETRRQILDTYQQHLPKQVRLRPVVFGQSVNWLTTAYCSNRDEVVRHLRERGIDARAIWIPLHRNQPYWTSAKYPNATQVAEQAFWLPTYNNLPDAKIRHICSLIQEVYDGRTDRHATAHA